MKFVTIENDNFVCRVLPENGGSIHSFDIKLGDSFQPLLRHTKDDQTTEILDYGSWPLVPFSNRIKYGQFGFDGQNYSIEKNYLGGPNGIHASHGQGWARPWDVIKETPSETILRLSFGNNPDDKKFWPFPYEAEQHFEIAPKGMRQTVTMKNTGATPMPAGIGTHPYFPKTQGTTLQAKVTGLWEIDPEVIPVTHVGVPAEYDFRKPKVLDATKLDSCFDGYGGIMQIVWPDRPIALNVASSKNLGHFVVYTPAGENFFCAEPVSHMPDAINRMALQGNGLVILKPGETVTAVYDFEALVRPGHDAAYPQLSGLRKQAPLTL